MNYSWLLEDLWGEECLFIQLILLWMFLLHICLDPRNLLFTYFLELFYIRDGVRRKVFIFHHRFLDSKLWQFMALKMNFLPKTENYAKGSLEPSSVQLLIRVCFCNPMDCSTPGLPVHYQLLEFTQTYGHWLGDAIQPFHPLSSPSLPAFNLSQHQGLFQWVCSSHQQVAKVLEFQLQHQSFQWIFRTDFL